MTPRDDDAPDPQLREALARLPRTLSPTDDYTDRVLGELRAGGIVRSPAPRARHLLFAATWFIAGVGAGAMAVRALSDDHTQTPNAVTLTSSNLSALPSRPEEWY